MKRRIRKELLDELLAGYTNPEDLTGPHGLLKQLTGALVDRTPPRSVTLDPPQAAEAIVEQLRSWGYLPDL